MKTIFDIFAYDVRTVVKNGFALILIIGIGIFPAFYAWINLYATNDPYANTGNIAIAVASNDRGIEHGGEHVNAAEDVCDMLKDNHDIGWTFTDTEEQAVKGVEAGDYYAAIVFEDDFTYNMYHIESALSDDNYSITYYSNHKKNAVAPKLTDTAADTLLDKINTRYLETVFGEVFGRTDEAAEDLKLGSEEAVNNLLKQLTEARDALRDYDEAITLFSAESKEVSKSLKDTEASLDSKRSSIESDTAAAKKKIKNAKKTISEVTDEINERTSALKKAISDLEAVVAEVKSVTEPIDEAVRQKIIDKADSVLTRLQELRAVLPDDPSTVAGKAVVNILDHMIARAEQIKEAASGSLSDLAEMTETVKALKELHSESLLPGFKTMMADLKKALKLAGPLVTAGNGVLDDIDPVLDGASDTVSGLSKTLLDAQPMIRSLAASLTNIIDKVEGAEESDKAAVLTELLGGDPDKYSKFFTSLVDMDTHKIYYARSFGAAMVPFYTAIALWVGAVMLIATLHTNINRRKFPEANEVQSFFGRFILFFLVGQMQAAVTLAGEIFMFHCSPVHPWLLYLAAAISAMVFDLLIFAIVLAFGNVGKAFVIVLMVLQIAGSSGTFPMELLPEIFEKIYLFFPFPYAIDAMREGLSGMYGHDYLLYLAQLSVFAVIAVIVGVLVRKPFIGVDRFVTEKMEETEVL